MSRPALEVADIFRDHGPAWRSANAGHVSLDQLKVMSAIERCRTAALGGHVLRCEKCLHTAISYNSCRNRHCPKCQGAAAKEWLAEREAELLPVPYFHAVFSLPARIADIAYQNKAAIYDLLFKASSRDDADHRGRSQTSRRTHRPPLRSPYLGFGAQPSPPRPYDRARWRVLTRRQALGLLLGARYLFPVAVLSCLFRRLLLEKLAAAHAAGQLQFFGKHAKLADRKAFAAYLRPLRNSDWVVYCKDPFGGPAAVLRYLARYTHRVAISNRRLIASDDKGVTFKWKDYRLEGPARYKVMTLATDEFIRRFLMHVLPAGFHRIRYYGLLASGKRTENIARARELLTPPMIPIDAIKAINAINASEQTAEPQAERHPCPCCGGPMIIIERFERGRQPKHQPSPVPAASRIDTS